MSPSIRLGGWGEAGAAEGEMAPPVFRLCDAAPQITAHLRRSLTRGSARARALAGLTQYQWCVRYGRARHRTTRWELVERPGVDWLWLEVGGGGDGGGAWELKVRHARGEPEVFEDRAGSALSVLEESHVVSEPGQLLLVWNQRDWGRICKRARERQCVCV